ncbi:MAG: hypothetical protein MK211_13120 [Flavobacteriales bacterium]|jgi:hypothetical protein|uniref:hypothetical protein n=1 Tax=Candidatus Ulvibacter alkanivorans TaxID=2267620 RepID=UPI000DF44A1C|nr:hypothetical protein [Candidatus Ulvibacter alkanivorans]MCH2491080.1 hypothetical protein [Flavobacteriales bacterium]
MHTFNSRSKSEQSWPSFSILITIIFICIFGMQGFAQNCNVSLKVHKDRNARSAIETKPAKFKLELTNSGASAQTFTLQSERTNRRFTVEGREPAQLSMESDLNVTFYQEGTASNIITVPAYETVIFQAIVSLPSEATVNRWAGINIKAMNQNCNEADLTAFIKVFTRDPANN